MDFYNKSLKDFRNLKNNASARAGTNPQSSRSMTGGDWAGIGLQILGAISQQKAAEEEQRKLEERQQKAELLDKSRYADQRGDIEDQKIRQAQGVRFQGLNFLNDQVDSNRAMARKRTFRDAMYDAMRA